MIASLYDIRMRLEPVLLDYQRQQKSSEAILAIRNRLCGCQDAKSCWDRCHSTAISANQGDFLLENFCSLYQEILNDDPNGSENEEEVDEIDSENSDEQMEDEDRQAVLGSHLNDLKAAAFAVAKHISYGLEGSYQPALGRKNNRTVAEAAIYHWVSIGNDTGMREYEWDGVSPMFGAIMLAGVAITIQRTIYIELARAYGATSLAQLCTLFSINPGLGMWVSLILPLLVGGITYFIISKSNEPPHEDKTAGFDYPFHDAEGMRTPPAPNPEARNSVLQNIGLFSRNFEDIEDNSRINIPLSPQFISS
jgi:hypothetical protein